MADEKKQGGAKPLGGAAAAAKAKGQARAVKKEAATKGFVSKPRPKDYKPRMKTHYETEVLCRDGTRRLFRWNTVVVIFGWFNSLNVLFTTSLTSIETVYAFPGY